MTRVEELEIMLSIAREAAGIIARVYATDFAVDYKGPSDPVTQADREANALICARIAEAFGPVPVVAEESDESAFAGWVGAPRVFFVDPLDGTLEFVAKNGDFVVMIGLCENARPVAGVVLAPAFGTAWAGADSVGAFEVDPMGVRTPLRVSRASDLAHARAVVSRSHQSDRLRDFLGTLGIGQISQRGSAGLKAADVASGRADIYLQPGRAGKRWDCCAPEAIVRAAGGVFTDGLGELIDYGGPELTNENGFLVSNAQLHSSVVEHSRRLHAR
ncbi:MAG TPA: 3'(2'),5'-bisphosphate nucleotidase CysQ [Polyangiaceae bacterium]|nr:3'(2'),5'-bisphosphate nucleotidase CysQ [Polyangiaceae bacterium]